MSPVKVIYYTAAEQLLGCSFRLMHIVDTLKCNTTLWSMLRSGKANLAR